MKKTIFIAITSTITYSCQNNTSFIEERKEFHNNHSAKKQTYEYKKDSIIPYNKSHDLIADDTDISSLYDLKNLHFFNVYTFNGKITKISYQSQVYNTLTQKLFNFNNAKEIKITIKSRKIIIPSDTYFLPDSCHSLILNLDGINSRKTLKLDGKNLHNLTLRAENIDTLILNTRDDFFPIINFFHSTNLNRIPKFYINNIETKVKTEIYKENLEI